MPPIEPLEIEISNWLAEHHAEELLHALELDEDIGHGRIARKLADAIHRVNLARVAASLHYFAAQHAAYNAALSAAR